MKKNIESYRETAEILKVLGHPVRLKLIEMMITKGPTNVTEMYEDLQMPQSTIRGSIRKMRIYNDKEFPI